MFYFSLSTLKGDIFGGMTAAVIALPIGPCFRFGLRTGPNCRPEWRNCSRLFCISFWWLTVSSFRTNRPHYRSHGCQRRPECGQPVRSAGNRFPGRRAPDGFGALRLGSYVSYTPYSIVSGFMSGIGVIIILIQTPPYSDCQRPGADQSAQSRPDRRLTVV